MTDTTISPAEGEALPTTPSVVYYFGCEPARKGHYLWNREWYSDNMRGHKVIPQKLIEAIDGFFVPENRGWQSSRVGPWLIISCIDNTVDTRPGSHSTFVGTGFADEAAFVAAARAKFPSVFERLKA